MIEPYRQLTYQRAHKAAGLCQMCKAKAFKGASRCKRHMQSNGKNVKLRDRWLAVDWSLRDREIAEELGVSSNTVRVRRWERCAECLGSGRVAVKIGAKVDFECPKCDGSGRHKAI